MQHIADWLRQPLFRLPRLFWLIIFVLLLGIGAWFTVVPQPAPLAKDVLASPRIAIGQPIPQSLEAISPATAAQVAALAQYSPNAAMNITRSPDQRWFAARSATGITIYDARSLAAGRVINLRRPADAAAVANDGQTVGVSIEGTTQFQLWRADGSVLALRGDHQRDQDTTLRFSPSGALLLSLERNAILVWRTADGALLRTINVHADTGQFISDTAVLTSDADKTQIWPLNRWWGATELDEGQALLTDDRQTIITANRAGFTRWNADNQQKLQTIAFDNSFSTPFQVSPDGATIGVIVNTGSTTDTVGSAAQLLRAADGQLAAKLQLPNTRMLNLAFAPNSQMVAGIGENGIVGVWQVADGKLMRTFEPNAAYALARPDQAQLVWGYEGKLLFTTTDRDNYVWRVQDGTLLSSGRSTSDITYVSGFSLNSSRLHIRGSADWRMTDGVVEPLAEQGYGSLPTGASLDVGGSAGPKLWQLGDPAMPLQLPPNTQRLRGVRSPDGMLLAVPSGSSIQLWRVADGVPLQKLYAERESGSDYLVQQPIFSADGSLIVAATSREITLWRVADGRRLQTLTPDQPETSPSDVASIALGPDGIVYANVGSQLQRWQAETGEALPTFAVPTSVIAFTPDGSLFAAADAGDTLTVRQVADGSVVQTLQLTDTAVLAFSRDGSRLATATKTGNLQIWQFDSRAPAPLAATPLQAWQNPDQIAALAFSEDNTELLAESVDNPIIWRWRINDARLADARLYAYYNQTTTRSPDGMTGATFGAAGAFLWNMRDGSLLHTLDNARWSASFAADGKTLVTSTTNRNDVVLWRVADGTRVQTITPGSETTTSYSLNADGSLVAVAVTGSPTVQIYRTSDGALLYTIDRTGGNAATSLRQSFALALSPDGQTLAASNASDISLWNVSTGGLLTTLTGHQNLVFSLAFSPDSRLLASGSGDGTVRLWAVAPR